MSMIMKLQNNIYEMVNSREFCLGGSFRSVYQLQKLRLLCAADNITNRQSCSQVLDLLNLLFSSWCYLCYQSLLLARGAGFVGNFLNLCCIYIGYYCTCVRVLCWNSALCGCFS